MAVYQTTKMVITFHFQFVFFICKMDKEEVAEAIHTCAMRVPCPLGANRTSPCQASRKPTTSMSPSSTKGAVNSLYTLPQQTCEQITMDCSSCMIDWKKLRNRNPHLLLSLRQACPKDSVLQKNLEGSDRQLTECCRSHKCRLQTHLLP